MTSQQIDLVEKTFAIFQPAGAGFAQMFYRKLFALDPSLRARFGGDAHELGLRLMGMLAEAVQALRRMDQMMPAAEAFGKRHAANGVREKDYATFAAALLWTLEQVLSRQAYTPDAREAWGALHKMVLGTMQRGAASVEAAA
jgi:hemoglobin-like flavoprotein